METQEYLKSLRNEINELNAEIQKLEKISETQPSGSDQTSKVKSLVKDARGLLDGVKNRYEEYSLKKDLAIDEAKSGLDMARADLKETYKSIRSLLQ